MSAFVADAMPTVQDIEFYNRNGWLLTQLCIRPEYIEACRKAASELYAAQYDEVYQWSSHEGNISFGRPYDDRSEMRYDCYVSHHKMALRNIVRSAHLGRYAAALLDTPEVRLYRDLILSVPGGANHHTGWHVDKNYWRTASSEKLTTVWFPLSDCDEQGGCLVVVNASHAWKRTSFIRKVELTNLERLCELYECDRSAIQVTAVPHRCGQISFHHCRLVHGALPNESSQLRQSFVIGLQDADNHYAQLTGTEAARFAVFNTNDHIGPKNAQGHPDYLDEQFYPTLYRARGQP